MSIAKSVFSSLGRTKATTLQSTLVDEDGPLSYLSFLNSQHQFELQSNEIHEIDSGEVALHPNPELAELCQVDHLSRSSSTSTNHTDYFDPASVPPQNPASHTQVALIDESLINWEPLPSMSPISPADFQKPSMSKITIKPRLQVNTKFLDYCRSRCRRRSKSLVQSSSVRSTSSTASTNSSSSTASTISPISTWSEAWARSHGFNSTMTSPDDDAPFPDDAFPCQPLPLELENGYNAGAFAHFIDGPSSTKEFTELPAEVPATLHVQGTDEQTDSAPSSVDVVMQDARSAVTGESRLPVESIKHGPQQLGAHALVHSFWDTLELHITESMAKLEPHIRDGTMPLVMDFQKLTPKMVATRGVSAMSDILRDQKVTSSSRLLCFAHVVYSLSVVVRERFDSKWWTSLFTQTLSYGSWLPQDEVLAYIQTVDSLWKPKCMSDGDFETFLQSSLPTFPPLSACLKGGGSHQFLDTDVEPMVVVSRLFLDGMNLRVQKILCLGWMLTFIQN